MVRTMLLSMLIFGMTGTAEAQEMPSPETSVQTSLPPITISDSPVMVAQVAGEMMPAALDTVEMAKLMLGVTGKSSVILTNNTDQERTAELLLPEGFTLEGGGNTVVLPPHSPTEVKFTYEMLAPPADRMLISVQETAVVTLADDPSYNGEFSLTGVYMSMKQHGPMLAPLP